MRSPVRAVCGLLAGVALAGAAESVAAQDQATRAGPEVFVCEPHNRALAAWLEAARDGRLPRRGVTLVHIDSHADLGTPPGPRAPGWSDDLAALVAGTHIANFVLAAVRVGVVERVVWVHPPGSHHFADGVRRFQLGAVAGGALRVDDASDFYVLDGGWAPSAALRDAQPVELRALTLEAASREALLAEGPTILDIDLDAFATRNPAADALRRAGLGEADLERLRGLFDPSALALSADPPARAAEVEALMGAVGALARGEWSAWPGALGVLWQRGFGPGELASLAQLAWNTQGPARDALLQHGRDVVAQPELAPDPAAIAATARRVAELVERGAVVPWLVTVARSVDDGYTPREAWPAIEWRLIVELARVLPGGSVRFDAGLAPAPHPPEGVAPPSP